FERYPPAIYSFLEELPPGKWDHRYAAGKWSVKELVQHLIDAERIFSYRALTFARMDMNELPGFDENAYAAIAPAQSRTAADLLLEYGVVQKSSALLFRSFGEQELQASGIANNNRISVLALGFVIIGHALHHQKILRERYL
ncbi:MAG TPA: DinB family protein, partial [Flavisolibacter sp.]